jgi:hypothetical protein
MAHPTLLAPLDYLKRLLDRRYKGLSIDPSPPKMLRLSQLQVADVLFCRGGKKHIPWQVISYGSSGCYVHVAIYAGNNQVVESTMDGVVQSPLTDLVNRYQYIVVTRCPGTTDNRDRQSSIIAFCSKHVQNKTKYDVVGASLSPLFELFDLAYQRFMSRTIAFNWPRNKKRTFCSQFVLDAFVDCGYIPKDYYALAARSPTALAEDATFELIGFLSKTPNIEPLLADDILWMGGG